MGEAKHRGTFKQRREEAIRDGRVYKNPTKKMWKHALGKFRNLKDAVEYLMKSRERKE